LIAFCTILAAAPLVARPAFAGPTPEQIEEGRNHFTRGVEYYKENDFRNALVEFKRAYDIAPNWKVLYNLGYTSLELQDYAAALRSFERYLADGGSEVPADKKAKVQQELDKLQKRVARITVEVNAEGAEVLVDDVVVGKSPLPEPVLVSAGRRKIVVNKGGASQTRVIDVAGGDATKVSLELEQPKGPTGGNLPPPPGGETPPPSSGGVGAGFWVSLGITGALGVGTVVTGVLALSAKGKFDDTIARAGVTPTDVDDARSKTRTLALVTDVLGGATIAGAIVTVIVGLTTSGKSAPKKDAPPPVSFSVSPFGASLSGAF
jgi:hypothetical protein